MPRAERNRITETVYLSLGSNLGDRAENLRRAVEGLREIMSVDVVSSVYETAPVGVTDQAAFLNIAVGGSTNLTARELLRSVKEIEETVGRKPTFRWGPRIVDIDILLFGSQVIDDETLTIPHREMRNRAFVLVPLCEIAPDLTMPTGERICELATGLDSAGVASTELL